MKTIALTLFAAVLGMAQSQSSQTSQAAPTSQASPITQPAPPPEPNRASKDAAPAAKAGAKTPAKAASKTPSNAADNKKPAPAPKAAAAAQAQTVPAGAVLVEPFTYRYTDSNGKVWMYRQTPFGISKWEESATPAPQPPPTKSEPVVVTDLGDSVRFARKTPFGGGTWVRKKTDLTDEEKAWVSGQQEQSNPTPVKSDNKVAGNK